MSKKSKILNLEIVDSVDSLAKEISKQLKLTGWQFDKLTLKQKLAKYLSRNPDKRLSLRLDRSKTQKAIEGYASRTILQERMHFPTNYDMTNPLNRWFDESITRTKDDDEKINAQYEREYQELVNEIERIAPYIHVTWSE